MNEQIRKLYEQANIRHTNDYALSGKPREEWRSIPDLFAELIIKECVGMLDDEDDYGPYSTGVRSAAYRIKKHFGVEQ
jgi:hypothetical protein